VFAGLLPSEIEKQFPSQWKNDEEEGGKNLFEDEFFRQQLKRLKREDIKFSYNKIVNNHEAQKLVDNAHNLLNHDLSIIVYNFVDMLSHARTELEVLKELASDEASYRSLTLSWFIHSPLAPGIEKN
jgi:D-mannonate dehydratase